MSNKKHRILIVDDDRHIRLVLVDMLTDEGYLVDIATNGQEALEMIESNVYSLVIMDVKMPKVEGIVALEIIKEKPNKPEVIIMTAYTTMDTTVEAMKHGAFEYIIKPFDIDEVISLAARAIKRFESRGLQEIPQGNFEPDNIIGNSPAMLKLFKIVGRIALTDSSILITGETGTGKDLFARAIHRHSARRKKPFVVVNCASIPADLLESELFGHVKGAFTGASNERKGKCEIADGGTLFLDEIGIMRYDLQAKLLTFLQKNEFEKIGSSASKPIKVDVRVIAATNANLKELTEKNKFREDLYYRLMVVPIHIIPLRERREDIPLLAKYFVNKFNSKYGLDFKYTKALENNLKARTYSGNVRELENYIHRIVVLQSVDVEIEEKPWMSTDIPAGDNLESINVIVSKLAESGTENLLEEARAQIEKPLLSKVMSRFGDNQSRAAKALGVSRNTLRKMLAHYEMFD